MDHTELSQEKLVELYRLLLFTRRSEEHLIELYRSGRAPSLPHSSIGQEAVGVASTFALEPKDLVSPTLRGHGVFLAKGVPIKDIMAEVYKKKTGPSGGKWSYHHISDTQRGVMLTSAVIAGSVPPAVGAALASKLRGSGQVMLAFFGDGGSSRGDIHEAMNMAAVMDLPVVFIVENNLYAMSVPIAKQTKNPNIGDRAAGYGIPGVIVDGCDALEVYHHTKIAVDRARRGEGPTLIECKTYRWRAHMEMDNPDDNRPADELAFWRSKCPVKKLEADLRERGYLDDAIIQGLETGIAQELKEAVAYAESSPSPLPEEVFTDVYA
ncbi:MAG: thiamine pyrophosphate-dependent dehydrogenase E1 component subunit alpha [Chloroflexi bacterium]|nr:thiamine pyrophosphate-dependent dehydrogenase E1 component subunit alpha [Chloroflexota bacterium]